MHYRRLGKTELEVSVVGFGGIPIQRVDEDVAVACVQRAIELGVNFLDTARGYGDSENKFGKAIKGMREKVYVATKGHGWAPDDPEHSWNKKRTSDWIRRDIEESLKALDIDKIDLYQIWDVETGSADSLFEADGAIAGVHKAMDEGLVDHIGITSHAAPDTIKRFIESGEFETIMVALNFLGRSFHTGESVGAHGELIAMAAEHDMGVIVMKPMGGGVCAMGSPRIEKLIMGKAKSMAEFALRYCLSVSGVCTVIPGMQSLDEVEQNVAVGEIVESLDPAEIEAVVAEFEELGVDYCRGCGYCLPCTANIEIPEVFRALNYYKFYDMPDFARQYFKSPVVRGMTKAGVERGLPSDCVECGDCEERCPFKLPIRDKMKECASIFEGETV